MANISVQELQEIAIQCTSDFFNNDIPLNVGLAKQASLRDLNSDQLKRAVEATNTLTHLKGIEVSKDRTSEFPVAQYDEILKLACIPGADKTEMSKAASATDSIEFTPITFDSLLKEAEEKLEYSGLPEMSQDQKLAQLQKFAQVSKRALDDVQFELGSVTGELLKMAKQLRKDPQGVEHLSATTCSDEIFTKVAGLVFGPNVKRCDFVSGMFKAAQINEAQVFVNNFERGQALIKKAEYLTTSLEKIAEIQKQSFFLSPTNIGRGLGKGLGWVGSKIVGGTAGSIGNLAKNVAGGVGTIAKNTAQNTFTKTSLGKKLEVPTKTMPPNIKRNIALGTAAGGAVMDAASYTPKVDPAGDWSGSTWAALNGKL